MHPFRFTLLAALGISVAVTGDLRAQFTNEVAVVRDGVRFLVRPSVTIATTPAGVVQVTLTQINARVDEGYGVVVDGVRETYTAYTRGLVSSFSAIRVTSLSLGITFDGVQGCTGRVGLGVWREGETMTASCNSGSTARLTGFSVNGLTTSGVLELQSEVRRRRALARQDSLAKLQQARQDSIARARAEAERLAAQRAAAARPSSQQPAQQAAQPMSTQAAGEPASAAAREQTAREQAAREQAEREAAAAQRALEALREQNAASQQRLEENVEAFGNSVAQVASLIAENNRRKKAREAEEAARNAAAYQARVARERAANLAQSLARFAEHPVGRACTAADLRPLQLGARVQDSLSLVSSCRTDGQLLVQRYQLRVDAPQTLLVQIERSGLYSGLPWALFRDGQRVTTTTVNPGNTIRVTPGVYDFIFQTAARGEVGTVAVTAARWQRSKAYQARFHAAAAYDAGNSTVGDAAQFGGNLALRGGVRLVGGLAAIGEYSMALGGGPLYDGSQEGSVLMHFGARLGVGSRWQALRPYAQWTTGSVQGVDGPEDFKGNSSRLSAGVEWFFVSGGGNTALEFGFVSETGKITTRLGETLKRERAGLIFGVNAYF